MFHLIIEGASLAEAMAQQAANLELHGLAILDRDSLYGSPRLYMNAEKLGIRSHIGAEVSVDAFGSQVQSPVWQPHVIPQRPVRLSLLCESQKDYQNLSLLISHYKLAQKTKGDGVAPFAKLQEYAEGLVALREATKARSPPRWSGAAWTRRGKRSCGWFGPSAKTVSSWSCNGMASLSRKLATNCRLAGTGVPSSAACHHGVNTATEYEREVLDVMTSIRHGCSLDESGLLLQKKASGTCLPGTKWSAPSTTCLRPSRTPGRSPTGSPS